MIDLLVLGIPAPQGSKSAVVRGRHAVLIEGASTTGRVKHKAWRNAVSAAAMDYCEAHGAAPDGPLQVTIRFALPKPKSTPKKRWWTDVKPDLDKCLRSTWDGLSDGGLVQHDQRIVSVTASKAYAPPGCPTGARITLRQSPADDPQWGDLRA